MESQKPENNNRIQNSEYYLDDEEEMDMKWERFVKYFVELVLIEWKRMNQHLLKSNTKQKIDSIVGSKEKTVRSIFDSILLHSTSVSGPLQNCSHMVLFHLYQERSIANQ